MTVSDCLTLLLTYAASVIVAFVTAAAVYGVVLLTT